MGNFCLTNCRKPPYFIYQKQTRAAKKIATSCALRSLLFILLMALQTALSAQTLGGRAVFNFLELPTTPQLTAAGGINVSNPAPDIGLAFYNPALLKPAMHTQLNTVFNGFYAGIKTYHLSMGYRHPRWQTNFLWGLHYLDYGRIDQTDAAGNLYGEFRPRDVVLQLAASRSYLQKWNYGLALKLISSNYGLYRSTGIAADAGVLFSDTAKRFTASLLARNMGSQFRKYYPGNPEELPFNLVAGVTKRLLNAPFAFSVTASHLHQFDIRYNDTLFNQSNSVSTGNKKFTADKLFRHFILASHIYLGDKVTVTVGYNHLRRQELNIGNAGNGLNGFSLGAGLTLKKMQVHLARSQYQRNTGYTQLGLNLKLNEYFGLGKWGEKTGW